MGNWNVDPVGNRRSSEPGAQDADTPLPDPEVTDSNNHNGLIFYEFESDRGSTIEDPL